MIMLTTTTLAHAQARALVALGVIFTSFAFLSWFLQEKNKCEGSLFSRMKDLKTVIVLHFA
jgi:hypothetical protein